MRIKVVSIGDRGIANQERLHLSVLADANLVNYAIFDTVKTGLGATILPIPKHTYWFTPYPVKAGDQVVIFTGSGTQLKQPRTDGFMNHFFYWGLKETIWNGPWNCAVVLEIGDWATSP
jgi:hypothetical protein